MNLTDLPRTDVKGGQELHTIQWTRQRDGTLRPAFTYSDSSTRFSDPRQPPRYHLLYLGFDLETCFVETVVRDRFVDKPGIPTIAQSDLRRRMAWSGLVRSNLTLVDLTDRATLLRHRIDTDTVAARDHLKGQILGIRLHDQLSDVDGILYRSRLLNRPCVALFDRAGEVIETRGAVVVSDAVRFTALAGLIQHLDLTIDELA